MSGPTEFPIKVEQRTVITLNADRFDEQFLAEFRESFYNFHTIEEHAAHLAQMHVRGLYDLNNPQEFVEGYGPIGRYVASIKSTDQFEEIEHAKQSLTNGISEFNELIDQLEPIDLEMLFHLNSFDDDEGGYQKLASLVKISGRPESEVRASLDRLLSFDLADYADDLRTVKDEFFGDGYARFEAAVTRIREAVEGLHQ